MKNGHPTARSVRPGKGGVRLHCGSFLRERRPVPAASRYDTAAENSDVLSRGSVAVAVKNAWPGGTGKTSGPKLALQLPAVVTSTNPRNVWPSPLPSASQLPFEKNSTRKVVLAVLFSVPAIVTLPLC